MHETRKKLNGAVPARQVETAMSLHPRWQVYRRVRRQVSGYEKAASIGMARMTLGEAFQPVRVHEGRLLRLFR